MPQGMIPVWDLAVRVLHWSLVLSVAAAWLTPAQPGTLARVARLRDARDRRGADGLGIPRGRGHARFAEFMRSPAATAAYARDCPGSDARSALGHNPLGGWMVVALLAMVALVGFTGWLYTTDRFWGIAWVERLHSTLSDVLFVFVALHILGVVFTSKRHRENLLASMLHGRKRDGDAGTGPRPLNQPPAQAGSSGPPSQMYCASQALTRLMQIVSGTPMRKKSPNVYWPGFRISRLPWWPIGVRKAVTAPSAVQTMNGCGGSPSAMRQGERDRPEQHGGRRIREDLGDERRGPVEREQHGERGPADRHLMQLLREKGGGAGLLHGEAERDHARDHHEDAHVDLAVRVIDADAGREDQRDGPAEEGHLRRHDAGSRGEHHRRHDQQGARGVLAAPRPAGERHHHQEAVVRGELGEAVGRPAQHQQVAFAQLHLRHAVADPGLAPPDADDDDVERLVEVDRPDRLADERRMRRDDHLHELRRLVELALAGSRRTS